MTDDIRNEFSKEVSRVEEYKNKVLCIMMNTRSCIPNDIELIGAFDSLEEAKEFAKRELSKMPNAKNYYLTFSQLKYKNFWHLTNINEFNDYYLVFHRCAAQDLLEGKEGF